MPESLDVAGITPLASFGALAGDGVSAGLLVFVALCFVSDPRSDGAPGINTQPASENIRMTNKMDNRNESGFMSDRT
ncbi:hypothetical protein [Paraburkholderia sp. J12]|uniref:hypothetical protein n=1 Tax=Paraburkholderia sp. J12 TaxID=2805432 RepID=UPI002ABD4DED|nr:hypothetical protein [Paraburkholderia sp. J12]